MDVKSKDTKIKDKIVSSMAKKLANVSTIDDLNKIKKQRNRKPVPVYLVAIVITVCITAAFYFASSSNEEMRAKKIAAANLMLKDNPLTKLNIALKNDVISPDQFAMYCKDLLVRYDSLPDNFKTARPVISSNDVYAALGSVWLQLYPQTKSKLTKELPGLSGKIEHYMDSMGIR